MEAGATSQPIFILGIEQRTGTNYLRDLVCAHPDCAALESLGEDHLLRHAHHLAAYSEALARAWSPDWGLPADAPERLLAALGRGLSGFLRELAGGEARRPVTKTPSVENLELFFPLFPEAQLLVIVRDGRSVAASGAQSFRGDLDDWARRFAAGAHRLLAFAAEHPEHRSRMLVVRYEDLLLHLELELRRILDFLGLDASRYDFDAAKALPVRGSSELCAAGDARVHWEPVPRGEDFDPLRRFESWTPRQHARFNWLAGAYLAPLGYATCGPQPAGVLSTLRHGGLTLLRKLRRRLSGALARRGRR